MKTVPLSPSKILETDLHKVCEVYRSWPALAEQGARLKVDLPSKGYERVLFLGMGGSASCGDIIKDWLDISGKLNFTVRKGVLPDNDLRGALVIACSASGNTRETLETAEAAYTRGATIVSISAGGMLAEFSRRRGIFHVRVPELLAPRYSLPYLAFCTISVLGRAFYLEGADAEVGDAIREMKSLGRGLDIGVPTARNQSKRLALSLIDGIPKIYGSTVTRGAAVRFKNVLNENSKKHAMADSAPELFHNEIESWEDGRNEFIPLFLRHSHERSSDRERLDEMAAMLRGLKVRLLQVRGEGKSDLAQMLTLTYILDFASYYLAIALGRDPHPTKLIDRLKKVA